MLAERQQGNALAGATGAGLAAGGEEYLASQLYPGKNPSSLSEAEKQTVAALTTLTSHQTQPLQQHPQRPSPKRDTDHTYNEIIETRILIK
ncbi:VENN motif pre-toxin domain-containing protein [Nissabacter sp. SGAir0207]|uniref:VENN motif pre-toxin domain-containing protein n=1 Tax=Nissabacter sp. SGAir0207 TaxID=2126321 RepID=UPI0010F9456D|nr:VENN motif pre-toxin domain-containing protein [Nissabacter sp. SGAir0207]